MKNKIDKAFKLKKRNLIVTFSNCWAICKSYGINYLLCSHSDKWCRNL